MATDRFRIFISSVQDEFAEERRHLKEWLTTDLFISRFVESVFLFEDVPSHGKPPKVVYLDEVKASDIYIGLIGSQYYGRASVKRGVSATEQEYDAAERADCERWIYLKAVDRREARAKTFVDRVNRDPVRVGAQAHAQGGGPPPDGGRVCPLSVHTGGYCLRGRDRGRLNGRAPHC